jgi:hypothetical protein
VGYDLQSALSFILSLSGKSKFETSCDVTVSSCYILFRNFPVQAVWHVNDTEDYECGVANSYVLKIQ